MNYPDCTFVISVERGELEAQALLLVESLLKFGGRYANCPIYAVSPRPTRAMSQACLKILRSMGVNIIIENLLPVSEQYGTAARLAACVWAEKNLSSEIIVSLDNDLFFAQEPNFELKGTDLMARPVDIKGICTAGADDVFDPYWRKIAELCEVDYEKVPWLETTVDRVLVKASYNGGMMVVRRGLGLFQKADRMYQILKNSDASPRTITDLNVYTSTGFVGQEASRWWGSSQAVLSLAATQLEASIMIAPKTYNIPAHSIRYGEENNNKITLQDAVLVHYHWLLYKEHLNNDGVFYGSDTLPSQVYDWLKLKIPLPKNIAFPVSQK